MITLRVGGRWSLSWTGTLRQDLWRHPIGYEDYVSLRFRTYDISGFFLDNSHALLLPSRQCLRVTIIQVQARYVRGLMRYEHPQPDARKGVFL